MKINNLTISTSNDKLGGFIPTLNMPAVVTCREDAPCRSKCYGLRGNFRFDSVKASHNANLEIYKTNPELFKKSINEFLQNGLVIYRYFRWHSTGDIVDYDYFIYMVQIAIDNPLVNFLCFTKKYELINSFIEAGNKIPSNLNIVFSAWGTFIDVPNPYNLPVAHVEFKEKELNTCIPATAIPCTGKCAKCQGCWSLKENQSVKFKLH